MKLPLYQIDAFADEVFQGNPAAVCPLETWLPDRTLQAIAQENNLSETAFFVVGENGYELRWFTPIAEVDLCGHATLATAFVIFEKQDFDGPEILFHSRSGPLKVRRDADYLTLDFPALSGQPCEIPEEVEEALGVRPVEMHRAMDYMAVFAREEDILALQPDFELLRKMDARGLIVTARGLKTDIVCRFFAPAFGIDEDPVTGSAYCMLAPYWADRLGKKRLTARQLSKRTGSLVCEVAGDRVLISGKAVSYLEGHIEI